MTRTNDYSGQPFGRPRQHFLKRMRTLLWGTSTAGLLNGQDSIYAALMSHGMAVYGGYTAGTFENYSEIIALFPGAKYMGIAPFIAPTDCLDIEPGDAVPGDAPGFYAQATFPNPGLPTLYCSIGDAQAVIDAMSGAGIKRSQWYLWSAHYDLGKHLCGPSTCGYPQADGTQWTDGPDYDSDVFQPYMYAGIPEITLSSGMFDPASRGPVHKLQARINKWAALAGMKNPLKEDGVFGSLTMAAVQGFQAFSRLTVNGVVGASTWAALNREPELPTYPPPTGLVVVGAGPDSVKLSWVATPHPGITSDPVYAVWVYDVTGGRSPSKGNLVPTYPRENIAATKGQWGSLKPGTSYVVHVTASGPGGSGFRPGAYASAPFTTAAA